MRRPPIRLVAFDLDGTLLRGHTVCEGLAARLGRLPRMKELEATIATGRAEIQAAREEVLSWYEGHDVAALCQDMPGVALAPGAIEAFAMLRRRGVRTAIVSITWTFAVAHFARQLGADAFVGTRVEGPRVDHFWPEDKPTWVAAHAASLGASAAEVGAVGDSGRDFAMLRSAGRAVFVGPEHPPGLACTHMPFADMRAVAEHLVAP